MTLKDNHQKHAPLNKPVGGAFGRSELAFLGAPCKVIQELAKYLILQLSGDHSIAYVDAQHFAPLSENEENKERGEKEGFGMVHWTDKQSYTQIDNYHPFSAVEKRAVFNKEDFVIVNGNHYPAQDQVLMIHSGKNMENKLDRLRDVKLIILEEKKPLPGFLKAALPDWEVVPVFNLEDRDKIAQWLRNRLDQSKPLLNGLVLTGGESKRMQKDKGALEYHGKSQREHLLAMLQPLCSDTFLSCNSRQAIGLSGKYPLIADTFLGLGPMGGILSALRENPNRAWLVLACDLPYLGEKTLKYLIGHRNPSKIATAFLDPKGEFPEPLISIWEPKSYLVLLEYLSQGISCPRKVLINAEVQLLKAPDIKELHNVNRPEAYEAALKDIMMNREK